MNNYHVIAYDSCGTPVISQVVRAVSEASALEIFKFDIKGMGNPAKIEVTYLAPATHRK